MIFVNHMDQVYFLAICILLLVVGVIWIKQFGPKKGFLLFVLRCLWLGTLLSVFFLRASR